ncbi:MAG: AbrB/MazE/SpoVT family DNA-binding domain-containing protein [Thermoanaerobaculia bacterium]
MRANLATRDGVIRSELPDHDLAGKIGGTLDSHDTTKLSSKRQVVLPGEIRPCVELEEGTQFVVVGDRNVVIFKAIAPPAMGEFDELVKSVRSAALMAGILHLPETG